MTANPPRPDTWPALPLASWQDSYAVLHMWTQVIGKIRLAQTPLVNHWWNVPLYVTTRGLTTSPVPYGERMFEIGFDFVGHRLLIETGEGRTEGFALKAYSVAEFYRRTMDALRALGIEVDIRTTPSEVPDPVPFERDERAAYDPAAVNRFWRILLQSARVMSDFRAGFLGKASPVHFFWGSFDLAATRFSGREAPPHPGVPGMPDRITREAYSHEVSSAGFWPGGGPYPEPAFYAYAYPEPPGFRAHPVRPAEAFYSEQAGEFILPYEAVRRSPDPDATLLAFLEDSYVAAAEHGGWDRAALERGGPSG